MLITLIILGLFLGVFNFNPLAFPDITLNFGDVFKRVGSDEVYRVTSQGNDKTTPRVAGFRFSQVTAERWELTT